MNIYQLLEQIMEALGDGRKPEETQAQFKARKADELEQHFNKKEDEATAKADKISAEANKEGDKFHQTKDLKDFVKASDLYSDAQKERAKATEAQNKGWEVYKIKHGMNKTLNKSEALEILEDIYSAIDKKYPKNSERNKELKDSAYKSKTDAEEVAKQHELGKRPESAPMKGGWDIRTWEIPAETPEEREYSKKESDYDIKQIRKEFTKNKTGEHDTKKKQFPKSYKDVGVLGEPDAKELETERVARRAVGKRKAKMSKNEALEIMENIVKQVEKRYGKAFGDDTSSRGKSLHRQVIANDINEIIAAAKRNLPDEEKGLTSAIDREYDKIQDKRIRTKDKVGQAKTDARRPGGLYDQMEEIKSRKEDASKGYPKAIEKSIKRHEKKVNEVLEIMEEIINEVSIKKWKEAAANSIDKRKEVADNTAKTAQQSWDDYEEYSRKHPEEEDALYKRAWRNDIIAKKAEDKADHALDVLHVKTNAKSANKAIKAAKNVEGKREAEYLQNNDPTKFNKLRKRMMKVDQLISAAPVKEALAIVEAIIDYADNLFELDYEEKQNISPNKISRVKKDKNGEKVEVVSVADELFPYEGSAKEQFNKKVLDKINAMIEGNGSLEDLIQFVRAGVKARAHESLDEGKEPNKECEYRKAKWEEANQKYFDIKKKHLDWEGKHPETRKAYDEERKAYADLDKARRDAKKVYGPYESCEELLEGILDMFKKENKDPVYNNPISKDLRDKQDKVEKHTDDFVKYATRADQAKGYRKQINQERAVDADRAASKANKEYRHAKGEVLDHFRKRGVSNPQAHKMVSRMMGEAKEMLEMVEGLFTNEDKNIFGKETDRGSLEDDISKTVTGKTLNQHIEGAVKKVTEPKKIEK